MARRPAARAAAPIDLDDIRDDLGIPAGDTSNDAWLQRRIDGIWARFQQYTGRSLLLSSRWVDDWGKLVTNHPAWIEPPMIGAQASASVYLRVFPVQSIVGVFLNGGDFAPSRLIVEPASGKLVGLDGMASDLRTALVTGRARVEYSAGFETIPADLYEALLGVLTPLWSTRQAQASGASGVATRIATTDLGEIEFSQSPNVFVDATLKGVRTTDPLLGPWGMVLDTHVDWRSLIGGAYPSTSIATSTGAVVPKLDFSKAANSQYVPLI